MSSHKIVLVFDIVLLILGLYACAEALRMKKTGIPPEILIPKEERPRLKDAPQFCRRMYLPTVLFGCMSCAYGGFDFMNRWVLKLPFAEYAGVVCFLGGCYWYVKKLLAVKGEYL